MNPSADTGDFVEITNQEEFNKLRNSVKDKGVVVLCVAEWYEPCKVIKENVQEMVKIYKDLVFTWVDCDKFTDLVEKHGVDTAPTVLIFHPHNADVSKIVNPSPEALNEEIEKQNEYYKVTLESEKERVFTEIDVILSSFPLVCFIKGTPTEPKCKFTRRLLAHMTNLELTFKHFDILGDERIRQWLKVYSNWQTYPQVYINKKFVGGIDIIDGLIEENEFLDMVPKECRKQPPIDVFEQMLGSFDVVVIVHGQPSKDLEKESQQLLDLMDSNSVKYVTVDYNALHGKLLLG